MAAAPELVVNAYALTVATFLSPPMVVVMVGGWVVTYSLVGDSGWRASPGGQLPVPFVLMMSCSWLLCLYTLPFLACMPALHTACLCLTLPYKCPALPGN